MSWTVPPDGLGILHSSDSRSAHSFSGKIKLFSCGNEHNELSAATPAEIPDSLHEFAEEEGLPEADIQIMPRFSSAANCLAGAVGERIVDDRVQWRLVMPRTSWRARS